MPEGKQNPPRDPSDLPRYNAAARRVMESRGVLINDLYAAALPRLSKIQLPVNVHFNDAGWDVLGSKVAAAIQAVLEPKLR